MAAKDGWDLVPHSEKSWKNATLDNGGGGDARNVGLSSSSVDELKSLINSADIFKVSATVDRFANELGYVEDAIDEFRRNGVDSELMNVSSTVLPADDGIAVCSRRRHVSRPRIFEPLVSADHGRRAMMPIGSATIAPTCAASAWTANATDGRPATLDHRGQAVNPSAPIANEDQGATKWTSMRRQRVGQCVFCRNNGDSRANYESHVVKDRHGRVTCPVLRQYTCPICFATGDEAHTIRYCPLNKHRDRTAVATLMEPLNNKFASSMIAVSSCDAAAVLRFSTSANYTGSSCVKLHKKRSSNKWLPQGEK